MLSVQGASKGSEVRGEAAPQEVCRVRARIAETARMEALATCPHFTPPRQISTCLSPILSPSGYYKFIDYVSQIKLVFSCHVRRAF